jgi:homoserine kinase
MAIRRDPVRVSVPASSANLGPMFDCAGLALEIRDEYTAMVTDDAGVRVEVEGEGAGVVALDETHLVVRAMALAFDDLGERPAGFMLRCHNVIPHGRGLGSSAAAIIGGMALARAMVVDGAQRMSDADLLTVALALESHPDNLSAALVGGCTVAWVDEGRADCIKLSVHPEIAPAVFVHEGALETTKARALLAPTITRADAVFNISRAALLTHALTVDPGRLFTATQDHLHQDARADAYPESTALLHLLRAAGVPAVISGAGPSVLAFGPVPSGIEAKWAISQPGIAHNGAYEMPIEAH